MGSFNATGADGIVRPFVYLAARTGDGVEYWIQSVPRPEDSESFELRLVPEGTEDTRITIIDHHGRPEYARMGIPEAILPIAARETRKRIVSSRGHVPGTNEFMSPDATRMWGRLEAKGLAHYDTQVGRYILDATK